ncbi:MAG: hypothetical protein V1821_01320, partial [bacterium]
IAYSRLTNRFVPWFSFINAKSPADEKTKDFSTYLTDINQGLGFPGKLFFDDPEAKPGDPYRPKEEIVADLQGKSWKEMAKALKEEGEQANLEGYKDSLASTVGYDSYLSQECFEFVPITAPEGGQFEYNNNESIVKISTGLKYAYDGNPQSPFSFSWPLENQELAEFVETQRLKRKELDPQLGGNPQNYSGTTPDGTWWELDQAEISSREQEAKNTYLGSGLMKYEKIDGKTLWRSPSTCAQYLTVPDYVNDVVYKIEPKTDQVRIYPSTGDKHSTFTAENLEPGLAWSTKNDANLLATNGLVRSPALVFNEDKFRSRRTLNLAKYYIPSDDWQSQSALQYTFLKYDPFKRVVDSPIDNPNVVISGWDVKVLDKRGEQNFDLSQDGIVTSTDTKVRAHLDGDTVTVKLNPKASEARFVEITGKAPGVYELMFFDGSDWRTIYQSYNNNSIEGHLAWWDVSRLNGKYTLLFKSAGYVATSDVFIGTVVSKAGGDVWSTYKRAQLHFPPLAFGEQDQLVTITPVTMTEIKIRNRPILMTHGPIVEIKPSPWKFEITPEDKRPTLKFIYTFDELKDEKVWNGAGTPEGIPWNIHQVTANGDLQIVDDNLQSIENNNGEDQYVFSAPLNHFSTYTLLDGKFSLSAPLVFASRYITNQESVTIYGTAEPNSVITCYVKSDNEVPDPAKEEPYAARLTADDSGAFSFAAIKLVQEGKNYIFVTSHNEGNVQIRTMSDLVVEKDTISPQVSAEATLAAFSPNSDGRFDSVDYILNTNEQGKLFVAIADARAPTSLLLQEELIASAEVNYKLNWAEGEINFYQPGQTTNWLKFATRNLSTVYPDGDYLVTVYAIDSAGNVSENILKRVTVDRVSPKVLNLTAVPNPFTPNDDGVKDTSVLTVEVSEPSYVKWTVNSDQWTVGGRNFRKFEGPTENFVYPTIPNSLSSNPSSASWEWNGRGARNELLGGEYTYSIVA